MDGFVEDDHRGAQSGQRDVQAAASRGGFQLLGEMLQVSVRRIPEELEEVVVESVGVGAVDDEVGDGEDLEQEAGPLALFGAVPEQPLRVDDHHFTEGVERRPHAYRAGLLSGRGFEYFSAHEEGVVQGVRFAFSRVAKDGHHLQQLVGVTAEALYKRRFLFYLPGETRAFVNSFRPFYSVATLDV